MTLGDPSGIGPELVARALASADHALRRRLLIFGDRPILDRAFALVTGERTPSDLDIVDRGRLSADQAVPGQPSEAGARAQVGYLEAAVSAIRGQGIAGLVTAPISKHAVRKAGFAFAGHTEFLAERLGARAVAMMFAGPRLKVVLATVHVPLIEVAARLDIDGLATKIVLGAEAMERDFGVSRVRVAVAGLNPHAGERGLFGREEIEIITPAIEESRRRLGERAEVMGPVPGDAVFRQAVDGACDVVVAMYHDQGLIPMKLVDFEHAVNLTLGLPVVRTSPDHGVAYDLAGTGKASQGSFQAALDLAVELVDRRARE
jgi:4-hydroxythreonine-4-phosphate dehydrogenase